MEEYSVIGSIIALFTTLVTYKGFKDREFFEKHVFEIDPILVDKQYPRLISSGFLHVGWVHLAFNLIALLSFSAVIELLFGPVKFLLLYFGSMLGGSLLALFVHRNHADYSAVGASGAVSGVIFSYIILDPTGSLSFILIPIEFPAWAMGIGFVLISIFGMKSQSDNIGHDAHLGGAVVGALMTIAMYPSVLSRNLWIIAALLIPSIAFIILIILNPNVLIIDKYWGENIAELKDQIKNPSRTQKRYRSAEEELDELLDKIRRNGINSLSDQERRRLDDLSGK